MKDALNQEIKLGDLVAAKMGSRRAVIKPARVIRIGEFRVRIVVEQSWGKDGYRSTGSMDPGNVVVIEREFLQPILVERLEKWDGSSKKKLHEVLDCPPEFILQWIRSRCTSLER